MDVGGIFEMVRKRLSPPIVAIPDPDGDGILVATLKGDGGYALEQQEGQRRVQRRHVFVDLVSLAEWLKAHAKASSETEILIGPDDGKEPAELREVAGAILGGKELDADTVEARIDLHPAVARWLGATGKPLSQRELLRLAIATREHLVNADQVVAELAKFQAASKGEFQHEYDERGFVRYSGGTATVDVKGALPTSIAVDSPFYVGVGDADGSLEPPSYRFEFLLDMAVPEKGPPIFAISCPGLDLVRLRARQGVVAHLRALLGEGYLVGSGFLKTEEVPLGEPTSEDFVNVDFTRAE